MNKLFMDSLTKSPVAINPVFLESKAKMKISDYDFTTIIYLMNYAMNKNNVFDIEGLMDLYGMEKLDWLNRIESLLKMDYLELEASKEQGVYSEYFSFEKYYKKVHEFLVNGKLDEIESINYFDLVEDGFKKTLNSKEIALIDHWTDLGYNQEQVMCGIELCLQNDKISVYYLNSVLKDWMQQKKYTREEIHDYLNKSFGQPKGKVKNVEVQGEYYNWLENYKK